MRQGKVFYNDIFAGIVTETNDGEYTFVYQPSYIDEYPKQFLTFSMPVTGNVYKDKRLFPFFEGLIPEGWLLDIASDNWKINKNDRMGLLLACCKNCIGAVSVKPIELSTYE
ncbi:HipA N-terminal domain-containing protein [Chryseobacterium sp. Ch-15]|uniref:HipA N-terminal domain-containing protein n=1 Tax=Chryseobacterium muglaense TaxID=2893752 RepID=A0A9Q3YQI1_9FLAO|nr:HipA N-terminal domain-containing protein [Chryseobacterium muglaense]MBD3906491.1 HipA N-terminal domain-containing protein [Chryseobacterium muglaense]MCC9033996.1 HipA N-terminal domain-containing protein [Chryseobacterium muglaense]MCM2556199.1 HipA N-terminal domain-containing protein [Chryseobacterium muglaense]